MLVRSLIGVLILQSIAFGVYFIFGTESRLILLITAGSFSIAGPLLIGFGYPIWIIRCRVRVLKASALEATQYKISNLDLTIESDRGEHAYLMTQQMYIESRWEWPLSSHLQTIILFGLLPPMTWVMAATIENVLFGG